MPIAIATTPIPPVTTHSYFVSYVIPATGKFGNTSYVADAIRSTNDIVVMETIIGKKLGTPIRVLYWTSFQ